MFSFFFFVETVRFPICDWKSIDSKKPVSFTVCRISEKMYTEMNLERTAHLTKRKITCKLLETDECKYV